MQARRCTFKWAMQGTVPQWAALSAARTRRRALAKRPSASAGVISAAVTPQHQAAPRPQRLASSSAIRSGYSAFPLGIEQRFPQAGAGLAIDDIDVVRLAFGSIMIRSVFPMMPSCGPRGAKVASKPDSRAIIGRSFPLFRAVNAFPVDFDSGIVD
jgi:hypothetical protein